MDENAVIAGMVNMANRIQVVAIVLLVVLLACSCTQPTSTDTATSVVQQSLVRAAWHYDAERVNELVDKGANLAGLIASECPALIFDAARTNEAEMVSLLLDCGVPMDLRTEPYANSQGRAVPAGRPLVFTAVEHGSREVLALLLDSGVSVDTRDDHGLSLLHFAYANGQFATVSLLLEYGADPTALTNLGYTGHDFELFHVTRINSLMEVRQVLGNGADPNVAYAPGQTVLNEPASLHNREIVSLLLDAGANPNVQDAAGCTPLHHAANGGLSDTVTLLIAAGADPDLADSSGLTPLKMVQQSLGVNAAIVLALENATQDR